MRTALHALSRPSQNLPDGPRCQHNAKRFICLPSARLWPRLAVDRRPAIRQGVMGERERLEQEHADKMSYKKRDESDVRVQFQIDSYKKVFAEQRLVVAREAEKVQLAKLREEKAQKVVDDALKQELQQIVNKQLEAVKLKRSSHARQSEGDLMAATGFAPRHPDSVEHIGTASRKLVRQMDPLFGCAAPLSTQCAPQDARAHQTTRATSAAPCEGGTSGLSAGLSLMQHRILPYPRCIVVAAGRPSRASSLSTPAYPASRALHARRRSPPCLPRTDHRTTPSSRPRRRQQHGACKVQPRVGVLWWARAPSASRKHRSSLASAPRSARSPYTCLRTTTALGRPPRLPCWRRLTTPGPMRSYDALRRLESEAVSCRDRPRPSRDHPPWRHTSRGSGRGRTRARAAPRDVGPRPWTRLQAASSRPRSTRRPAARRWSVARRPRGY